MTKKQKKMLIRILITAVMLIALKFIPITGIPQLIAYLADEGNQDELLDSLRQLSDGADEHRL